MKRYRKNQIKRWVERNKGFLIALAMTLVSLVCIFLGVWLRVFQLLYLIPIFGIALCFAVAYGFFKIPWLGPHLYYRMRKGIIQSSIETFKKTENRMGLAVTLIEMGMLYEILKDYPVCLEYYLQALEIFDELQKDDGRAMICYPIASIYERIKEFFLAQRHFELGLEYSKASKDWDLIYEYLLGLGEFYEKQEMDEKAQAYYAEADQMKALGMGVFNV